jgi:hypothetical protein
MSENNNSPVSSYDDIEISDSELAGILGEQQEDDYGEPVQVATEPPNEDGQKSTDNNEATEVEVSSDENEDTANTDKDVEAVEASQDENTEEAEDKPVTITVEGDEYPEEEILNALEDSKNRKEWQRSNTEKAQNVADSRKAIEPLLGFRKRMEDNSEFRELIEESVGEMLGDEAKSEFKSLMNYDESNTPSPFKDELTDVQNKLAEAEGRLAMIDLKAQVKRDFKLTNKQTDEVIQYAADTYEKTGRIVTPEESYKILQYDKLQKEAEKVKKEPEVKAKKKPNPPKTAKKNRGVKEIEKPKDTSYESIDLTGYNLWE